MNQVLALVYFFVYWYFVMKVELVKIDNTEVLIILILVWIVLPILMWKGL